MHTSGFSSPRQRLAWTWTLLVITGLSLAACGGDDPLVRSFGQDTAARDELRVAARPPLSMPPEFTLRPSPSGTARMAPAAPAALDRATPGQEALLYAAGPPAASDIRARVNEDAQVEVAARGFTDELMGWQRPPGQPPIIDRKPSKGLLGRIF